MRDIQMKRTMQSMGEDIVILLKGGRSHIGTQVTAIPYEKDGTWHVTLQMWNMLTHKDDVLAVPYARELALLSHHTVICICGIHIDAITPQEIAAVSAWCEADRRNMRERYMRNERAL